MEKVLAVPFSQITQLQNHHLTPNPQSHPQYNFFSKQFLRRHGRDLFSCSTTWFLIDVVFYSSNLFQSLIYQSYIDNHNKIKPNAYDEAFQLARLQAIVAVSSTIPGYLVTVYLIDRIGRVKIQFLGFCMMSLSFFIVGVAYKFHWGGMEMNFGFLILYCSTFFFANFGPNTTTFIVPAELFPARFRSTCHGIAGACGKLGAIVGSLGFLWASRDENGDPLASGLTTAVMIFGGVCVVGAVVTWLFGFETMGRSLEENENQNEDNLCLIRCVNGSCLRTNSSRNEDNIAA